MKYFIHVRPSENAVKLEDKLMEGSPVSLSALVALEVTEEEQCLFKRIWSFLVILLVIYIAKLTRYVPRLFRNYLFDIFCT